MFHSLSARQTEYQDAHVPIGRRLDCLATSKISIFAYLLLAGSMPAITMGYASGVNIGQLGCRIFLQGIT
jgi:hypothetical protein